MASVNKAIIIGHLGKDPDMRYLPSGEGVCNFSVATSEQWKDKSTGEKKEQTEWHKCSAFSKLADICGKYLKKGSQVYIEGRIQTRKWQDKDGQDRYTTEIKVDSMKMLGRKSDDEARADNPAQRATPPAAPSAGSFDDFEDDIPFLFNMNTLCDTMGQPLSLWRAKHGKGLSVLRANKTDF